MQEIKNEARAVNSGQELDSSVVSYPKINLHQISAKSKKIYPRYKAGYLESLETMPSPGTGFNPNLLKVAWWAHKVNVNEDRFVHDVIRHVKKGSRPVKESEIRRAYQRSVTIQQSSDSVKIIKPKVDHEALCRLVGDGESIDELVARSPQKVDPNFFDNFRLLFKTLYFPFESVFVGPLYPKNKETSADNDIMRSINEEYKLVWQKEHIRRAVEWNNVFTSNHIFQQYPFFMINPLTGKQGSTSDGRPSFRSDSCISSYRYCLLEFDEFPGVNLNVNDDGKYSSDDIDRNLRMQAGFWLKLIETGLPVVAITHSGGKSLHVIYRVDCRDKTDWNSKVRDHLFGKLMGPLGVDIGCKNPSRLSRFPGHFRDDGKYEAMQQLLYLNPEFGKGEL